jgi:hypothetical protein
MKTCLRRVGYVCTVLLPLLLLMDPRANFYYDWHNHQWFAGYFGEYLAQHLRPPQLLNTPAAIGMPQPVFYGFLLFPSLGLLSSWAGAALALRIASIFALGAQFVAVYLAVRNARQSRLAAFTIGAVVSWTIYPLTNLYNRAAVPEFFSVAFLYTGLACAMGVLVAEREANRVRFGWFSGVFLLLTVGSHPPTALVAAGLVAPMLLIVAWAAFTGKARASRIHWLGIAALAVIAIAPWIYANVAMDGQLAILGKYTKGFSLSSDRCDSLLARFAPFPYDPEAVVQGTNMSTPYIEAPLSIPLVVLLCWQVYLLGRARSRDGLPVDSVGKALRWLLWLGVGWALLTVGLSVSRSMGDAFRFLAPYVQFSTRFVSHANAGLLLAVLVASALSARSKSQPEVERRGGVIYASVLVLAWVAVLIKLIHGAAVIERNLEPHFIFGGPRGDLVLKGRADAATDYAVPGALPAVPVEVGPSEELRFSTGSQGEAFGVVASIAVASSQEQWRGTNVVVFPWNRLLLNGSDIPPERLAQRDGRIWIKLPEGEHSLEFWWSPPELWKVLNAASQGALLLTLLLSVGFVVTIRKRFNVRPKGVGSG